MERITATFDAKTLAAIRKVAGPRGVSAFLQAAARERLARLQVLDLLDDLDAAHGAPGASVVDAVASDAATIFGAPARPLRRRGARR